MYDIVVRNDSNSVELAEKSFHLTGDDGALQQSKNCNCERATTASTVARKLTGSDYSGEKSIHLTGADGAL